MPEKEKKVTRRKFLGNSLKAGAGIAAATAASRFMSDKYSPYSIFASKGKETEITPKEGLAPGMIGGPTGFEGGLSRAFESSRQTERRRTSLW
jgi:hypothetical protein